MFIYYVGDYGDKFFMFFKYFGLGYFFQDILDDVFFIGYIIFVYEDGEIFIIFG